MKYILASASPRRRELLKEVIDSFDIIPSYAEEVVDYTLCPKDIAKALAKLKCEDVFSQHSDCICIGCDTIVVFEGRILGKPKDREDAVSTLKMLSGKTHEVITGVCITYADKQIIDAQTTLVTFENLTDQFILSYVEGGSPMDKAGSYGIQDNGVVKSYSGSYTNVVGLPVELLKELLQEVKV